MPSIRDIIYREGLARPDVYPEESKARWLLELEGKLYREVIMTHCLTAGNRRQGPEAVCAGCGRSDRLEYNRSLDMTRCGCGWDNGPEYPEKYPDDVDAPLLVDAPYDNLYDLYIRAQVDLANRESDNYNDSASLFEQAKHEWQRRYHQTHRPVNRMDAEDWRAV